MTPALALYEARMEVAAAHRELATLLERAAVAEQTTSNLWNDPDATPEQLRTARQESLAVWVAATDAQRRVERLQKAEYGAFRLFAGAVAEGR